MSDRGGNFYRLVNCARIFAFERGLQDIARHDSFGLAMARVWLEATQAAYRVQRARDVARP